MPRSEQERKERRQLRQKLYGLDIWKHFANFFNNNNKKTAQQFVKAIHDATDEEVQFFETMRFKDIVKNMLTIVSKEPYSSTYAWNMRWFRNLQHALQKVYENRTDDPEFFKRVERLFPLAMFETSMKNGSTWYSGLFTPSNFIADLKNKYIITPIKQLGLYNQATIKNVIQKMQQSQSVAQLNNAIPKIMIDFSKKEKIPNQKIRKAYAQHFRNLVRSEQQFKKSFHLSLTPTVLQLIEK